MAEVLITLGIIGVVAALTLPTLIANYKKQVYVNQLKKNVNTISNGFRLAATDMDSTDFSITPLFEALSSSSTDINIVNTEAKKYFNLIKDIKYVNDSEANEYKYLFYQSSSGAKPNGYLFVTLDGEESYISCNNYSKECEVRVDVNGYAKGPNTTGRDYFGYVFSKKMGIQNQFPSSSFCDNKSPHSYEFEACFNRIIEDNWQMNY